MTIQPGESREETAGQHHQARDTQELMEAADQMGQRQEQRHGQNVGTEEFPAAPPFGEPGQTGVDDPDAAGRPRQDFADQAGLDDRPQQGFADQEILVEPDGDQDRGMRQDMDRQDLSQQDMSRQDTSQQDMDRQDMDPRDMDQQGMDQQDMGRQSMGRQDMDQQELRGEQQVQGAPSAKDTGDEHVALFEHGEADGLRSQWHEIQSEFVDDPQHAVQGADQLVAQVIQSLTASFAAHKQELDSQWQRGDDVATEDLRLALRRYRTLFNQLLDA